MILFVFMRLVKEATRVRHAALKDEFVNAVHVCKWTWPAGIS